MVDQALALRPDPEATQRQRADVLQAQALQLLGAAGAHLTLGRDHNDAAQLEAAQTLADRALEKRPDSADAQRFRAGVLRAQAVLLLGAATAEQARGDPRRAGALAEQALLKWPDYDEARRFVGDETARSAALPVAGGR